MTKKKKRLSVSEFLSFLRAGLIEERHTRADVFFKKMAVLLFHQTLHRGDS